GKLGVQPHCRSPGGCSLVYGRPHEGARGKGLLRGHICGAFLSHISPQVTSTLHLQYTIVQSYIYVTHGYVLVIVQSRLDTSHGSIYVTRRVRVRVRLITRTEVILEGIHLYVVHGRPHQCEQRRLYVTTLTLPLM
ncbi:unnamed protein product, partial [Discosporangium mesarthrocarpum]